MNGTIRAATGLVVWLTAAMAVAQDYNNPTPSGPPTFDPSARAVDQSPLAAPTAEQSDRSPSAKWRYRWYEGTWWYWSPSKRWYVWAVDRWVPYEDLAGSMSANANEADSYRSPNYGSSYYGYPAYYGAYYPRGYRIPWWLWVYRYRNGPLIGNRDPYAGRYPYAGGNRSRAGYGNYGDRSPRAGAQGPISGGATTGGRVRAGAGGFGGGGLRGGAGGGMRGGFGGGGRR